MPNMTPERRGLIARLRSAHEPLNRRLALEYVGGDCHVTDPDLFAVVDRADLARRMGRRLRGA